MSSHTVSQKKAHLSANVKNRRACRPHQDKSTHRGTEYVFAPQRHMAWSPVAAGKPADNQAVICELLLRTNGNEHFTRTDEAIRGFKLAQGARNFLPDRCSLLLVQPCQHLVQGTKRFTLEAHALVG
jgi:hypothetical protein